MAESKKIKQISSALKIQGHTFKEHKEKSMTMNPRMPESIVSS